jgi:hypothetical protein
MIGQSGIYEVFGPVVQTRECVMPIGYKCVFVRKCNDGNQGGPSLKDHFQVPDGPITRSRAKKIKKAMQGLVQSTWDEASKSPTIKVGLKEGEPILIHLIQAVEDMT